MNTDLSGSGLQFPEGDPQSSMPGGFSTASCSWCESWGCLSWCGGAPCSIPECVQCYTGCLCCVTSSCRGGVW